MGRSDGGRDQEVAGFRRYVLDRVLVFCFALLLTVLAATYREAFAHRERLFELALVPATVVVGSAVLWPAAPLRFRQFALIVGLLTASLGTAIKTAFLAPNAFSAQLLLVVLVGLVMGKRAAWIVWSIVMILWLVVAFRFSTSLPPPRDALFDTRSPPNWVRVLSVFGVLSATAVAAVTFLVNKMIGVVHRAEALHAALTEESAQKIAALAEQSLLQERLREAQKLEALGTLAGGIAHDFNNLLMVILSHAELAADSDVPLRVKESMQEIRSAGTKAAALTQQLLAFGRRQVVQRSAQAFAQKIEETLRMVRRLLPATIDLRTNTSNACWVWAAPVELDQVLINLCVNARDAMPDGGCLEVSLERRRTEGPASGPMRDYACLSVRDTGTGMSQAVRERLFEPLFTTKAPGAGTGLGMSTVHSIVEQLGGFLEVDSELGSGSCVRVFLPECQPGSVASESLLGDAAPGGNECILLVDDDRGAREALVRPLVLAGYEVVACESAERALALYQAQPARFDLIISDAIMPGMIGSQLYASLMRCGFAAPFLVCSGYTDQTFSPEFFDHPLRAFLQKPCSALDLRRKVRALLDARVNAAAPNNALTGRPSIRSNPC